MDITGKLDEKTYDFLSVYFQNDSYQNPGPEVTLPEKEIVLEEVKPQPSSNLTPSPIAPSPPGKKAAGKFVTSDRANLLKEEDLYDSVIIGTVPANTTLKVISQNGEFYKIKYNGKEGYIHSEFIRSNR